jgi:tellurite resistance protein TerC
VLTLLLTLYTAVLRTQHRYTLVSHAITDLPYLKPSVALVLGFVGGKMCLEYFHYEIGIGVSLSVVALLLAGGAGASVWENKRRARLALPGQPHSQVV